MTMNYCGRCGAANGTAARYCRQCGAELHNQAAFSSTSSPLNVEFSARNTSKDRQRETTPPAPVSAAPAQSASENSGQSTNAAPEKNQTADPDPKSISESLKRLRASGPLIVESVKKKQERMNQIIAESVESRSESKPETKAQAISPVTQTAPQPKTKSSAPATTHSSATSANTSHRRNSMPFQTRNTGSLSNSGQLPPHGPSSVLAQASGLGKHSNFGSKVRIGLIAIVVVLTAGSYFLLRDRLTTPSRLLDAGRNLLSAEEQSAYLVRLGQRDREQGHLDDAIGYFQNALSLTPNNPDTHFLLAQTYANAKQTDEAMKSYQSLLRLAPDHLEARLQVAEIHRARGNWNLALQEYQRIIALDQNSPQAAVALATMEAQESDKPEEVETKASRRRIVAKNAPVTLPSTAVQANVSLLPQGMAAASGIKAPVPSSNRPEEKPDPRAAADGHKKLGLRYFNVREYRAAINEFLSALRLTPEDKDLYYFLGSSYFGLGQFALAHDYYKRVDSGNYVGVAQSGAARTEKAAREEFKRRETLKNDSQNQVKNETAPKNKGSLNNSLE